jgi:PPM family protein phosphatase
MVARRLAQIGPFLDSQDRVREALGACNREVPAAAARDPALTTMGTTVAGVVVTADRVLAFNVGDSGVYAAGPGGVHQLSTDDRLSGEDLPPGIVTQVLGGSDQPAAVDPHLITSPLSEDTSYLICTDGLTDPVPAGVLTQTLREHHDGRAVVALWKAAVEAGGPDNITIVPVRACT